MLSFNFIKCIFLFIFLMNFLINENKKFKNRNIFFLFEDWFIRSGLKIFLYNGLVNYIFESIIPIKRNKILISFTFLIKRPTKKTVKKCSNWFLFSNPTHSKSLFNSKLIENKLLIILKQKYLFLFEYKNLH